MILALGLAAQLAVVARAPESVAACQAFEVTVAVRAAGAVAPQLVPPIMSPFEVLRSSGTPQLTLTAGGPNSPPSLLAEYRYVLATEQTGSFVIPPFEARLGLSSSRSTPIRVVVRGGGAEPAIPNVVARARVDTSLEVNFRVLTVPETVYVGQQANYEVAVFLNESVRDRLKRNPTFYPPEIQSMLAYDLPNQGTPPRRKIGSRCFDALVYQRALFPLMAGRYVIPPAQLVYALPVSSSFFSREETHELRTDSSVIVAIDPPTSGRPAEFTGAVGNLRVSARLDTTAGRVGDPVMLTVRVAGTGNVKLFPRPDVKIPWAKVVRGDERVAVDTTRFRVGGSKEFDWVLTPTMPGELDLPPIRYSYFDPDQRRYSVAATSPTRLRVATGALAAADTERTEEVLSLRTRYRGAASVPLSQRPVFWALLALAPIPAFGFRSRSRARSRAMTRPVEHRDVLAGLSASKAQADACSVRRAYTNAFGDRLGVSPEVFTRSGALARALRRAGVSAGVAIDAESFLRALDEAAYSREGSLPADASRRAKEIFAAVDREALSRHEIGRRARRIFAIFLTLGSLARAVTLDAAQADARGAFDRGVEAYHARDYASARAEFAASARAEPRAPDAWANYGTAGWAMSDTAAAVIGWQRALRMEPLAADLRDRSELAHALPLGSAGYVMPVPVSLVLVTGFLLWVGAFGFAAYRARLGVAWGTSPRLLAGAAVVLIGLGLFVAHRASGEGLGVMRKSTGLSEHPVIGEPRGSVAIVGEVVHTLERRGAWHRVRLDDGHEGWVESSAIASLDVTEPRAD